MEYKGKLYCKLGSKYVELLETSEDFDNLKEQNRLMNEKIKELKLLNIAYQSAIAYDNCPDIDEAEEIKSEHSFAENLQLSDIKTALDLYAGWSPSDFESRIVNKIICL